MAVLQQDQQRPVERDPAEKLGEGLEQSQMVRRARVHRPVGVGKLGRQQGQLGAPGALEIGQHARIAEHAAVAERADPGPEGQDLLALVGPAEQDRAPAAASLGSQLGQQPALADARLAHDRDDAAATGPGFAERRVQARHLGLTADQRRVGMGDLNGHRDGAAGVLTQDVLVQRLGFGLGLDA